MTEERLDWIERWLTEWKEEFDRMGSPTLNATHNPSYYAMLPLDCAVNMGLEMVAALKDAE